MTTPALATDDLWSRLVGLAVDRDGWIDGQSRARQLREQSDDIADRLEGQGIPARMVQDATVTIGLCTGSHEAVVGYRNSNLIPIMQGRNVHDMLKHVKHYVDQVPRNHLRMWVVSWGWVPMYDYRWNHKEFCRRLSRLAADPLLKEAGVEIVYYSIEDTFKRASGVAMMNLHAHLIVRSHRRLGRAKWTDLMARCRGRFPKGYIHDSKLVKPAECVKYCFKWNETCELSDIELASLFRQTFKLKFYHPLGPIRQFRKELNDFGVKLAKVPGKGKTWRWCVVEKDGHFKSPFELEAPIKTNPDTPNQVVGFTMPSPKFSPRFEPCVVVRNFSGSVAEVMRIPRVRKKAEEAWYHWEARLELEMDLPTKPLVESGDPSAATAGAAGSMRHTTTTTVREMDDNFAPTGLPPPPETDDVIARWGWTEYRAPQFD